MGHTAKHDEDFYAWTQDQAARLRDAAAAGANVPVDWENLAEEIESVGRRDVDRVASHLSRVIEHLLKLEFSPAASPHGGWRMSVRNARGRLGRILAHSPSLRRRADEEMDWAWKMGRANAVDGLAEDGLRDADLPTACPYTVEQVLDEEWWPASRHGLE
ncbi:DUF29 domain-containing protein [Azospirillum sp. A39]|uniref:DUF29 domain-containing protein n=1 Tax=Azospirillum sp. A39 TaxID=3462279 RepID=UPI004045A7F4